jgi:putative nucleotidyltransferase with HDIG domain
MNAARGAGGGRAEGSAPEPGTADQAEGGAHQDAISGLAEALLERDRYTGEHSESVVNLVAQVARGLALDENEVQRIRAAALLHDIGKVAIPDDILNKPGALDDAEWEVMREHPVIGERILRAIPGLGSVARVVRHEHERYDGGGYPDGLAGDDIPIGARIILACDAYHAMVSDRPYRKAMPHAEAIRELAQGAGTQFDPAVTEILIGCLYSERQGGSAAPAAA